MRIAELLIAIIKIIERAIEAYKANKQKKEAKQLEEDVAGWYADKFGGNVDRMPDDASQKPSSDSSTDGNNNRDK